MPSNQWLAALIVVAFATQGGLHAQPGRSPTDVDVIVPVASQTLGQPFQQSLLIIIAEGEIGNEAAVSIPVGKLLVVENLSAFATLPFGQTAIGLLAAEQRVDGSIQRAATYMPFTVQRGFAGRGDLFTAAFPTLLFADAATFRFFRDSDVSFARVEASVSGYLIDE